MKKVIIGIIVVLLVAAIGVGGWYLVDLLKKSNDKVNELENRITKMEENKVSTNNVTNTTNVSNETVTNTNVTTTNTTNTTTNETTTSTAVDYSKYYGVWTNDKGEVEIKNIGNGYITCTWFVYRLSSIDDVTLPFKDNKAVFYYKGYTDSNHDGVREDAENYYRKATIELMENGGATVKVEEVTAEEIMNNMSLNKSDLFTGAVYATPGEYVYLEKDETPRN